MTGSRPRHARLEPARSADITATADRLLDARFNHALVVAPSRPLAARIKVTAGIASDKALRSRQWLERGTARLPMMTVCCPRLSL